MPTLSPIPAMLAPSSVEKTPHTPEQPPKSTGSVVHSPHPTPEVKSESCGTVNSNSSCSNSATPPVLPVLKRPILVSKDYEATLEEEDLSLDLLYDYTTLNAW